MKELEFQRVSHPDLEEESTFLFPPPSLPPRERQVPSIAPLAMDAADEPVHNTRRIGWIALTATALSVGGVALVFGGYAFLSSNSGPPWGSGLGRPAAAAAAPVAFEDPEPVAPPATPATAQAHRAAIASASSLLASRALDQVLHAAADKCREEGMTPATVSVTAVFGADGKVVEAHADARSSAANVAACLARAARTPRIDPPGSNTLTVTRTVTVR